MGFEDLIKENESKILGNLKTSGYDIGTSKKTEQRTEEWFQRRKGRFTGSGIKNLMGCTHATAKLEWGRAEKLVDFNDKAIKYIYSKAKEIQRNKVVHLIASAAMNYGTENEDAVVELVLKEYNHLTFKEVGFIEFIEGIAGASPDGLLTDKVTTEEIGYEGKCATSWDTLFGRTENAVDEKHIDFWQLQSEMLALKVDKILYAVAEPSENMFEPNITDVNCQIIQASKNHQEALINRCKIGHVAIDLYLKGANIYDAVQKACTNYDIKNMGEIEQQTEQPLTYIKENTHETPVKPKIDIPF
jgi:hypothetical protein